MATEIYTLTPRMLQHMKADLGRYHALFDADRCKGWEQEELFVRAIRADTTAQHQPLWREAGHDDQADIVVQAQGKRYPLQIKSGRIKRSGHLILSGHRLGRFEGDFDKITAYLNSSETNIVALPYHQTEDHTGRHHHYQLAYVPIASLHGLKGNGWQVHGKQYVQANAAGVKFSLRPSMSWQIWWEIPMGLIKLEREIIIP